MIAQASIIALDILLFVTLIYLFVLMRKLKSFQSHKADMRGIVDDVITATESARNAVDKLKLSVSDSNILMTQHFDEARKVELAIEARIAEASKLLADLRAVEAATARVGTQKAAEPVLRASGEARPEPYLNGSGGVSRTDSRPHTSSLATRRLVDDDVGDDEISQRLASISDAVKNLRSKVAQSP